MRRLVIVLFASIVALAAAVSPAPASTTENHAGGFLQLAPGYSITGQTFTVPAAPVTDTYLARLVIDRWIPRPAAPFTVTVSALGAGGLPTGAVLWTSGPQAISADGLAVVYPNIHLTPGTQYAFYLNHASSAYTAGSLNDTYPGGKMVGFHAVNGVWTFQGGDLDFKAEFNTGVSHTAVSATCAPAAVVINQQATCTATVANLGTPATVPTGQVAIGVTDATTSAPSCTLVGGSCTFTFTPHAGSSDPLSSPIQLSYTGGGPLHFDSQATIKVPVTKRSTGTSVTCAPLSPTVGQPSTCTAVVTDTAAAGSPATPVGTVGFTSSGTGDFSAASCVLGSGSCSVTYTPTAGGQTIITAEYQGHSVHSTSSDTETLVKAGQTIAFTSTPPALPTVAATYQAAASATSGLPVVFSRGAATTNNACTVSAAGLVTLTNPGTCVVAADQAGNGQYAAAPRVTQSLTVKRTQAIDTSQLPYAGFARMSMPLNAYGGASGNPVVLSVDPATNGACTISGNIVTYVRAGLCVINFNQAGNATYHPAPTTTRTIQVFGFGF